MPTPLFSKGRIASSCGSFLSSSLRESMAFTNTYSAHNVKENVMREMMRIGGGGVTMLAEVMRQSSCFHVNT